MTDTKPAPQQLASSQHRLDQIVNQASELVLGKEIPIRLAIACLLARGHLLIEDLPGVGKTVLAHTLAKILGLDFNRVQFTSDMLPADILGVSIYERSRDEFRFHPGPIFSEVVLADEINRATPKTQSALLEAMEEHQVSIEGETRNLPDPFFVIATQNPSYQIGTFPLPESQMDRFLMRIHLGYPDAKAERTLLQGPDRRELLAEIMPCITPEELRTMQNLCRQVHISPALLDYIQALVGHTRQSPDYAHGLSPRASLALLHSAQAWALMQGREYALPEDIQAILPAVVSHRLSLNSGGDPSETQQNVDLLLRSVAVP